MTRDRYARPVGICYANHIDIGGAPDERGLAVAFRRYPDKDVANEERAHGQSAAHGPGVTRGIVRCTIIIDLVVHCIYSLPRVMGVPPHHCSPKEPRKPRPPGASFPRNT
jgi:hypothetical protein